MNFWRGKRVFITGHTGFKGAWLALWLHDLGAVVSGFALQPPTRPSLFEAAGLARRIDHRLGDVRELAALEDAMARARPEVILHLAALSLVRPSYEDPLAAYATNVMGTANLLDAARRTPGVRAIVCVTSDKCYENREVDRPYREDDPMGGYDPYSSSKGCAELVTAAYRRSFFNPAALAAHGVAVATARAGNVIGGGDWARDRLVPDIVRALSAGQRPIIRFPGAVRPWQHVLEPLSGYLTLAERLWQGDASAAEGWNFGPETADARPVGWLADRITALWGDGAGWDRTDAPQPHEAKLLRLDITKARARLGWRPRWPLEEGLRRTVEWYRGAPAGGDAADLTLRQIRAFSERAEAPAEAGARAEGVQ